MRIEFVQLGAAILFGCLCVRYVLDRVSRSAGTILQGAEVDLRMHRGRLS